MKIAIARKKTFFPEFLVRQHALDASSMSSPYSRISLGFNLKKHNPNPLIVVEDFEFVNSRIDEIHNLLLMVTTRSDSGGGPCTMLERIVPGKRAKRQRMLMLFTRAIRPSRVQAAKKTRSPP
jgi:hypothetical protein